MTEERPGTPVHLSVDEPLPLEARAGDSIALTVRVSCSDQRDRAGFAISISGRTVRRSAMRSPPIQTAAARWR